MIGIGVDVGGTFVKFFVVNERGEVLQTQRMETDSARSTRDFIVRVGDFIKQMAREYSGQILAVAVGAPGDVDNHRGILRYNPNLKFTQNSDWPIADELQAYTGIRPWVANDATLAAWGIYETELKHQGTNVLTVTLGTGVGGGLILNGSLYQGSHGTAGEIGHMKIADTHTGPLCGCGAHGCLEAFVGTVGLKRQIVQAVQQHPDSVLAKLVRENPDFKMDIAFRAAEQGCPLALKIWEDTGFYLGIGIANLALILDLDTVVLTGGVSGAAPYFMPALKKVLAQQQIQTPFKNLQVHISQMPNIGGIGAALYALNQTQPK